MQVIMILADGVRADMMDELIGRGQLPNICRHFIEGGSNIRAVTSFPSTTGPAYLPFLTGCLPGTCNVPGIRWFDKRKFAGGYSFDRYRSYVGLESFCMGRDMAPFVQTIFELVPNSYSIFNPIARGAVGRRNQTRVSRIWHWYYAHLTDRWGYTDRSAFRRLQDVIANRDPSFVFAVFPGIDEFSHLSSPCHPMVLEQYRSLDGMMGQIFEIIGDDTAVFLVSDHGLSETHTHFCVNTFLEKRGLPAFFYPKIFDKKDKLSANMVSGNGMTHCYFKNHDGWARHTVRSELEKIAPGILSSLLDEPAVDIVAVRNEEGGADVLSRRGGAKVRLEGETVVFDVNGTCPFGYGELPKKMDGTACLQRTFNSEYPDAPFQIAHLIISPRAGDVIISAVPGYDLRLKYEEPEHKSSHGSLHTSHMRVPILCNVPFEDRPARTVDVFPTVLKMLGHPVPEYVDGRPLL